MKICTISYHSCPYSMLGEDDTGGMSVYLREISRALADLPGAEIDLFTRVQDPHLLGPKQVSPRIRIIHLKAGPERPVDRKRPYDFLPEFTTNLDRFVLRENKGYDIIHSHYWLSGLAGEWLKYRLGIPLVHTYHTLALSKTRVTGEKEHPCRGRSERHLAHVADAVISLSPVEKKSLIDEFQIPGDKVRVIDPGVNSGLFYPTNGSSFPQDMSRREEEKLLLYVGRIDPVKGLSTLIEALAFLKKSGFFEQEKLKLIVIGGGGRPQDLIQKNEYKKVFQSIKQSGLSDDVRFLGSREQEDLRDYYSAADALVVPSLYESFGLVVLEALACGTPVIASNVGRMNTMIKEGKNGLVFTPGDSKELAGRIRRFYGTRPDFWSRDAVREDVVGKFCWENAAEKAYGLFRDLAGRRPAVTTILPPGESPRPA